MILVNYVKPWPPGLVTSIKIETLEKGDSLLVSALVSKAIDTTKVKEEAIKELGAEKRYARGMVTFNENPKLMLWIITFSLMVGVSFTLIANVLQEFLESRNDYALKPAQWFWNIALFAGFLFCLAYFNYDDSAKRTFLPPFDIINDLKVLFLNGVFFWIYCGEAVAFVAASLAFFGTLGLNSGLINLGAGSKLDKDAYSKFRGDLNTYLATFSILIVFSILTISFINQALQVHFANIDKVKLLRSEFIYAYGFIFSAVLALVYVPIDRKLRGITDPSVFADPQSKASNSFFNNFQSLLSILAPLLGSGISDLIKIVST